MSVSIDLLWNCILDLENKKNLLRFEANPRRMDSFHYSIVVMRFVNCFLVSDALSSKSLLVFYKFYQINKQCMGAIEKVLCQQAPIQ